MRTFGGLLGGIALVTGVLATDIWAAVGATFPKANTPPVIDGVMDEAVWQSALEHTTSEFTLFDEELDGDDDLQVSFRGLWDDQNLYVAVQVKDDVIVKDDSFNWFDDSIEVYVDAQNLDVSDYAPDRVPGIPVYQFTMLAGQPPINGTSTRFTWGVNSYDCRGDVCDYAQNSDTVGTILVENDGFYTLEAAFPWTALKETPQNIIARGAFGFGIGVNDDDTTGDRDTHLLWGGQFDDFWHRSESYLDVELTGEAGLIGDFDKSGVLDLPDIDALTDRSAGGLNPPDFDLNGDTLVNEDDIVFWVHDLFNTWIGDLNLDHEFSSTDLVLMLSSGNYEQEIDAVWSTGDFTGDGRSNSSDLVAGLADGGYEVGPRATAAVPEPSAVVLLVLGALLSVRRLRHSR